MSKKNNILVLVSLFVLSLSLLSCGGESTVIYQAPTIQKEADLAKLAAREKKELNSYKLLDAEKGVYRIPIDSAIIKFIDENQ